MSQFVKLAFSSLVLTMAYPVRAGETTVQVERFLFADSGIPEVSCGAFDIFFDVRGQVTDKTLWSSTRELLEETSVIQWSETYYDPARPDLRLDSLPGENNRFHIDFATGIGENAGAVSKLRIPGYGFVHMAGRIIIDFNTGEFLRTWSVGSRQEVDAALCAYFSP